MIVKFDKWERDIRKEDTRRRSRKKNPRALIRDMPVFNAKVSSRRKCILNG